MTESAGCRQLHGTCGLDGATLSAAGSLQPTSLLVFLRVLRAFVVKFHCLNQARTGASPNSSVTVAPKDSVV